MDDLFALFASGQHEFGARVHAIREDQWTAPTPATEWNVADLVEHLIDEDRWAAPLMHGQDLESAAKVVEGSRSLPVDGGVGKHSHQPDPAAAIDDTNTRLGKGSTKARSDVAVTRQPGR